MMSEKDQVLGCLLYLLSTIRPGPCFWPLLTGTGGLSTIDWKYGSSAGVCAYLRWRSSGCSYLWHGRGQNAGRINLNLENVEKGSTRNLVFIAAAYKFLYALLALNIMKN